MVERTGLLTPVLLGFNIALATFVLVLFGATAAIFGMNYLPARRRNDPEAFTKAGRRAFAAFGRGLYHYVTAPPELAAANRIRDLEAHNKVLALLHKMLVREVASTPHSVQHFRDSIGAIGRLLLQYLFDDGPDLQHFRMAMFERKNDRLEYLVAINNHDWTAHSMTGFDVSSSFMGEALRRDRPMVYPRDKKRHVPYSERKGSRYRSFVAIPVPCGQGNAHHVGVVTVDYTGKHEVFTVLRLEALFAFAQLVYALYLLNVQGGHDG